MSIEDEKQKILLDHKLQVRRIFLDKLLLSLVIAAVAVIGNYLLERYKSYLTKERFLFEERLDVVEEIREQYDKLIIFNGNLLLRENSSKENKREYNDAVSRFAKLIDRKGVVLDGGYKDRLRNHVWAHLAAVQMHDLEQAKRTEMGEKYARFYQSAFLEFDDLTRELVWGNIDANSELFIVSASTKITPIDFLLDNHGNWRSGTNIDF